MEKILIYIAMLSALFLNTDAANVLGVAMLTTAAFSPMLLLLLYKFAKKGPKVWKGSNKSQIHLLFLLAIIIITFKLIITGENFFQIVFRFLIVPAIILMCFSDFKPFQKNVIQKCVTLFFLVESGLSILERLLSRRFFDTIYTVERYEYASFESSAWQFRSTSLLGHPLENGMAVATIIAFILFSSLSLKWKGLYFLIGYISLFCFNARGAIIIVSFFLLPIIVWSILSEYKKYRFFIYTFLSFVCTGSFYILTKTSFGGRLFNSAKVLDESANTRFQVFDYISVVSTDNILYGNLKTYSNLLDRFNLVGIENGIITMTLLYGIILTIPLLFSLFSIQLKQLKNYKTLHKVILLSVFWLIGTMNPNLIDPTQWYIFLFAYLAFKKEPSLRFETPLKRQDELRILNNGS